MRLLGRWPCTKIDTITITIETIEDITVEVAGVELDRDERNALAWRDGFRSRGKDAAFAEMVAFWLKEHGARGRVEFRGHIYHWAWSAAK
jgi:hypothetical protein